jgi:hypothetical protein
MNARATHEILNDIDSFAAENGNWLGLERLLEELWGVGVPAADLPALFRVFERFPEDDGSGVLWSIVHGVESLPFNYEHALRASMARQPSFMGRVMLKRLEKAK